MKRLLIFMAIAIAAIGLTSCEGLGFYTTPPGNNQTTDEYYVRYSIVSSWYVFGNVSYGDVHGTSYDLTGQRVNSWSVTIGPVKKSFSAWSRNNLGTNTNSANHTIEVSKNGGPFAQKAKGINSASYTINF